VAAPGAGANVPRRLGTLLQTSAGRVAAALSALLVVGVAAGLVALWPSGERQTQRPIGIGDVVRADVLRAADQDCEGWAGPGCRVYAIELRSGPSAGQRSYITLPSDRFAPRIDAGDSIRVARNVPSGLDPELVERLPVDDASQQPFAFVDFERSSPLLALVLLFAALVVVLGRWHGVRALLGLATSLAIVVEFLAPAILDGRPPLAVALVGSLAVMVVTIGISHGAGLKSMAAMLGTAVALGLTASLALFAVRTTEITGFSSEQSTLLLSGVGGLSLQGLVVAGIVVGALGVLDDVTVSQASTVLALRRANESLGFRRLFGEAIAVGRDHLGATVNTLVLAYAGAALPVLLIFNTQSTPFSDAVNQEAVAEQIVAMLVGSIGLIAAVPLTTAIAALLASRMPAVALEAGVRQHQH
jgi:uncharacterized membrane protein